MLITPRVETTQMIRRKYYMLVSYHTNDLSKYHVKVGTLVLICRPNRQTYMNINEMKLIGPMATFVHMQAKFGQENLLMMMRRST